MVYITGDTHGDIDIHTLAMRNFHQQKSMSKNDSLIVCGDFGYVWDGSKASVFNNKFSKEKTYVNVIISDDKEEMIKLQDSLAGIRLPM